MSRAFLSDPDAPSCSDAEYRGEGPDDERLFYCDKCGAEDCAEVFDVEVCRQTMSSPAEWEKWCSHCVGPDMDPNDREPSEDELEARRRYR